MNGEFERLRAALAEQRRLLDENRRLRTEVLEQVRLLKITAAHTRRLVRRMPAVVVIRRLPAPSEN